MSAALASLRKAGRRENLASELLWTAHIDQRTRTGCVRLLDLREKRSNGQIGCGRAISARRDGRTIVSERAVLRQPLLAPAVHQTDIGVAIDLHLPDSPRRKPVVVVAIEDNCGLVADAGRTHQSRELGIGQDVAPDRVAELAVPGPCQRAGYMAFVVRLGIHVNFTRRTLGSFP